MKTDNSKYDDMFFQADQQIKDNQITQAVKTLEAIIEENDEYGRAYNHLGWVYETKYRSYEEAEACYKKALKFAPEYTPIYLNYAYFLSNQHRFKELESLLDRALHVSGIYKPSIYNEYGIMYELSEKFDLAIDYYKKAVFSCTDNNNIKTYQDSIERCNQKRQLFAPPNGGGRAGE
jgi:Tfp pilus assembly protein PilF